jgi:hypothetical protein
VFAFGFEHQQRNVCRVALDKFIERRREKLEDDIAGLNLVAKRLFGGGLGRSRIISQSAQWQPNPK